MLQSTKRNESIYMPEPPNMRILDVSHRVLNSQNLDKLVNVIYNNFGELLQYPDLKHTKSEILRLLKSPNAQVYLFLVNGKIASYIVGEIMDLFDGRKVLYITYLFTAPQFRHKGLASQMMKYAEKKANEKQCDGMMLTCDTDNKNVYDFYLKRGFMPDLWLRKYTRYDVLYKQL